MTLPKKATTVASRPNVVGDYEGREAFGRPQPYLDPSPQYETEGPTGSEAAPSIARWRLEPSSRDCLIGGSPNSLSGNSKPESASSTFRARPCTSAARMSTPKHQPVKGPSQTTSSPSRGKSSRSLEEAEYDREGEDIDPKIVFAHGGNCYTDRTNHLQSLAVVPKHNAGKLIIETQHCPTVLRTGRTPRVLASRIARSLGRHPGYPLRSTFCS